MEDKISTTSAPSLPPKITKENIHSGKGKYEPVFSQAKTIILLVISALLVSVASYTFIAPNKFTIGGVSGIAILINVASGGAIKQSWAVAAMNIPLVTISFFVVKKRFAILSLVHILLQTLFLMLIEEVFPNFIIAFEGGERIFAAMAAGLCVGAAVALAFKLGGSTGGADIIAVMIQKKFQASSIAWMLFSLNCIVIGASFFIFYDSTALLAVNVLPIMMSVFESYIESKINDSITNGFQSAIEFRIITNKPEEMSRALMKELSRGVTGIPATGMYTQENRTMLLCVISRRQVTTLRRVMKSVDPDSFAVMAGVSQVLGLGFYTSEL